MEQVGEHTSYYRMSGTGEGKRTQNYWGGWTHAFQLVYHWDIQLLREFLNSLVSLGQMRHLMAILDNSGVSLEMTG